MPKPRSMSVSGHSWVDIGQPIWAFASILLLLFIGACGGPTGDDTPSPATPSPTEVTPEDTPKGLTLEGITYVLHWDVGGAQALDGGQGWAITNDQGLSFTLIEGYVVANSLALIPCDAAINYKSDPGNHYVDSDPSTLLTPYVEDLSTLETITLEPLSFESAEYCQAYYLAARIVDVGDNVPEGLDMTSISLTLTGIVEGGDQVEGEDEAVSFTITTSFSNSAVLNLDALEGGDPRDATLTLTRRLDTLFDGVDPRSMGEDELSWGIMKNLMAGTTIEVVLD